MKENDPVAAYFDKLPETHKRQFEERASGANFNFQQRLQSRVNWAERRQGDCSTARQARVK
jgi:hypothetical protein